MSISDQMSGGDAEASAQDAIAGCRGATSLDMAEHDNAFNGLHELADVTQNTREEVESEEVSE